MAKYFLDFEDFKKAEKDFKKEVTNCNKVLDSSTDDNDIFHAWKKMAESYYIMDAAARDVKDAMRERVYHMLSIVDV